MTKENQTPVEIAREISLARGLMSEPLYIGKPLRRREDGPQLRGQGRFVDDLVFPGTLEAAFVRSPHPHALIRSIDARAARALPGVHAVFTLDDLKPLLAQERLPLQFRTAQLPPDITPFVLASREVAFVGEAVAIVIADTRYLAEDAAALVAVDYEPLPAVSDCRLALAPGAPLAHRGRKSNVMIEFSQTYGDVVSAFARAPHRVSVNLKQHRGGAHSIEGRGVVASYDTNEERLTVWSSTQLAHEVRAFLMLLLRLDENQVRVVAPDVGGGFGAKFVMYPEEVAVAAACLKLRRAIKWIEDRREHFLAAVQERALDRAEVRRRNLVPPERMPYVTPVKTRSGSPVTLDSGDFPACLAGALAAIDYAGFAARQSDARARAPSRHRHRDRRQGDGPRTLRVRHRAHRALGTHLGLYRGDADGAGHQDRARADLRRAIRRLARRHQRDGGRHRGHCARAGRLRQPPDRHGGLGGASRRGRGARESLQGGGAFAGGEPARSSDARGAHRDRRRARQRLFVARNRRGGVGRPGLRHAGRFRARAGKPAELHAGRAHLRGRRARGRGRCRQRNRRRAHPALCGGQRQRARHQPDDRRRPGGGRRRPRDRQRAVRMDGL